MLCGERVGLLVLLPELSISVYVGETGWKESELCPHPSLHTSVELVRGTRTRVAHPTVDFYIFFTPRFCVRVENPKSYYTKYNNFILKAGIFHVR